MDYDSVMLQDKQDKNYLKGDFAFHTEHVVELVAKLLMQVESKNDIQAPVHVADKYAVLLSLHGQFLHA